MNYRPKNFIIQELVPPEIYAAKGDAAWEMLQEDSLRALQALRDEFGPITVNNWHKGGSYKESGLRDPLSKTGAARSQHKLGGAFDLKFQNWKPAQVYAAILADIEAYPLITVLENIAATPTWLHFDTRPLPAGKTRIWIVNP